MKNSRSLRIILVAIAILAAHTKSHSQQVAITWDDLPAHSALPQGETRVEIGHKLIAAMKAAHMPPVYGFVNGVQLEREPASSPMLKDWRDAGFLLGNHTWSHMNLNTSPLADWEADLLKNQPILQQYAGNTDWHWLRYPFLAEGDTPEKRADTRKVLAAHGYKIASVTMSFGDYMWNEPYARCIAKNDTATIAQLETTYLESASTDADFRRAMANLSSATTSRTSCSCTSAHSTPACSRVSSSSIATWASPSSHFRTPRTTRSTPARSIPRYPTSPTRSKALCRRVASPSHPAPSQAWM